MNKKIAAICELASMAGAMERCLSVELDFEHVRHFVCVPGPTVTVDGLEAFIKETTTKHGDLTGYKVRGVYENVKACQEGDHACETVVPKHNQQAYKDAHLNRLKNLYFGDKNYNQTVALTAPIVEVLKQLGHEGRFCESTYGSELAAADDLLATLVNRTPPDNPEWGILQSLHELLLRHNRETYTILNLLHHCAPIIERAAKGVDKIHYGDDLDLMMIA